MPAAWQHASLVMTAPKSCNERYGSSILLLPKVRNAPFPTSRAPPRACTTHDATRALRVKSSRVKPLYWKELSTLQKVPKYAVHTKSREKDNDPKKNDEFKKSKRLLSQSMNSGVEMSDGEHEQCQNVPGSRGSLKKSFQGAGWQSFSN